MPWDCEKDGHLWTDADPCTQCGASWSELYQVSVEPKGDDSVTTAVLSTEPDSGLQIVGVEIRGRWRRE